MESLAGATRAARLRRLSSPCDGFMTSSPAFIPLLSALYFGALMAVAHLGGRSAGALMRGPWRSVVYAVGLGVYCTSWTFYGAVGSASRTGFDFLAIYLGPMLVVGFGWRRLMRIIEISKSQNITSIADFMAARYGKSERVAALVCLIAVISAVPYIALQLNAVSASMSLVMGLADTHGPVMPGTNGVAFIAAVALAGFAVVFGTRQIDATENQDGLLLAIATSAAVKLAAFLTVGVFITYFLFDGFGDLVLKHKSTGLSALAARSSEPVTFATIAMLSGFAILLLPRQFHLTVVENRAPQDVRRASWIFPLYLVLIVLFVIPLSMAGDILLPGTDADMSIIALPQIAGAPGIAIFVFIGGLSAAIAMVVMEAVALAVMISNHLVMPLMVRWRALRTSEVGDLTGTLLVVRRVSICAVVMAGYAYHHGTGQNELATSGVLALAVLVQLAPAFVGGLVWRRGTSLGASAGLVTGFLVWAYTLLLPETMAPYNPTNLANQIAESGLFGLEALRPTALFGIDLPRLPHGVLWSLLLNTGAYIGFSLLRPVTGLERLQASIFAGRQMLASPYSLRLWGGSVTVEELRDTVARYLGAERTKRAFETLIHRSAQRQADMPADAHHLRFAEHLLASAIGAASARLVLSLLLRRRSVSTEAALRLVDDASAAIQHNRDMLQHALDHARQGITVVDRDLRIVASNQAFRELYSLPADFVCNGIDLEDILRYNAQRGAYGAGGIEQLVTERLETFVQDRDPTRLRLYPSERVIELRSNHLPDGGLVTTYTDITDSVESEEALARANETLERRVRERTEALLEANESLAKAKAEADEANASKTRFLAAASHDILQPLNAARLYVSSLVERDRAGADPALAENIDAALDAVEEILTALLDISRLDAGAMRAEISTFRIDEIMRQLQREFGPMAAAKTLDLCFVHSSLAVRSDRRLLRRLMQNLVSNAVKYTPSGKVVVGVRRHGNRARIEVWDTGIGIPPSKQKAVFAEFERLDQGARVARGLGLGLSIVERIARILGHPVTLTSLPGRGSRFTVEAGIAAVPLPMPAMPETRTTAFSPLAGMTVLAIDNEPAILAGMRTLLNGWGCQVLTADGLTRAREAIAQQAPDVIIADYHLDDGDGIEVITVLRWSLTVGLPAILITADRTQEVRDAASARDIHILNKPLKPAALRALLAHWRVSRGIAAE